MAETIASLTVTRSGGVAGMTRRRQIDGATLTQAQAAALAALAAAPPKPPSRGADRFSFAVTLTLAGGATRAFTVPEEAVPEALADILR